jgi:hypothetical protein
MDKTVIVSGIDSAMAKIRGAKQDAENCKNFLERNQLDAAKTQIRRTLEEINSAMNLLNSARAQLVSMPN